MKDQNAVSAIVKNGNAESFSMKDVRPEAIKRGVMPPAKADEKEESRAEHLKSLQAVDYRV